MHAEFTRSFGCVNYFSNNKLKIDKNANRTFTDNENKPTKFNKVLIKVLKTILLNLSIEL